MANYREHVTVSSLLGLGYGLGGVVAFGFNPVQGLLATCLTGLSGMLPDLDSDNGRPVREMFGLLGAVAPLLLVNRVIAFLGLAGDPETIMLVIVGLYVVIKYGGAEFIRRVSVHRGMFHSLPALLIAAEVVFLAYPSPHLPVKAFMAGGVAFGFLSHLLLDELYSVHFKDNRLTLKKSSGTALKWSGEPVMPNVVAYTLMATLTYATLFEAGWFEQHPTGNGPPPLSLTPSQHVEGGTPFGVDALATDLGTPQGLPKVTAESTNPWELAPPQGQTSPDPFPVYAAERQDLPQPPR